MDDHDELANSMDNNEMRIMVQQEIQKGLELMNSALLSEISL